MLFFAIFVQCYTLYQILFAGEADLQDRVVWEPSVFGYSTELRAVPFFLGRVATLLLWSLRVLFRMCASGDSDALIMIQGVVQFDSQAKALKRAASSRPHSLLQKSTVNGLSENAPSTSLTLSGSNRVHPSAT